MLGTAAAVVGREAAGVGADPAATARISGVWRGEGALPGDHCTPDEMGSDPKSISFGGLDRPSSRTRGPVSLISDQKGYASFVPSLFPRKFLRVTCAGRPSGRMVPSFTWQAGHIEEGSPYDHAALISPCATREWPSCGEQRSLGMPPAPTRRRFICSNHPSVAWYTRPPTRACSSFHHQPLTCPSVATFRYVK